MFDTPLRIFWRLQHDSPEEIGSYPLEFSGYVPYPELRDMKGEIRPGTLLELAKTFEAAKSLNPFEGLAKGQLVVEIIQTLTKWDIDLRLVGLSKWRSKLCGKEYSPEIDRIVLLKECNEINKAARELMAAYAKIKGVQIKTTFTCRGYLVYIPNAIDNCIAGALSVRCVAVEVRFVSGQKPELFRSYPINFDIFSRGIPCLDGVNNLTTHLLHMDAELVIA
eukprot:Gregarina_sp_Poly_1__6794@NODE_3670_length_940_cov_203_201604_g2342_i0_p1_GENE_NODE_3670_length_940_cov_203_201604_g2342_i0NODE_3670_length_940_cov_203_201604_g2342_i0_p1_ORF_typecomplete_len231_score24_09Swi5/PF07061_11/0_0085_NODE_3670_length_940_cov_203_201604_g2342_i0247912